jgi:hypothetical protein
MFTLTYPRNTLFGSHLTRRAAETRETLYRKKRGAGFLAVRDGISLQWFYAHAISLILGVWPGSLVQTINMHTYFQ